MPGIGVIIGFFSICVLKVVVIVCRVPFNGSYIPFRLGFAASLPEGVGYLEEQRQSKKHSSNAISQNSYNWLTQQTKVGPKILKVLQRQTKDKQVSQKSSNRCFNCFFHIFILIGDNTGTHFKYVFITSTHQRLVACTSW